MPYKHASLFGATSDALRILGSHVRSQRLARKETQAQLAARADVSARTVSLVEAGSPSVLIGTALNVAVAAGVRLFDARDDEDLARLRAHSEQIVALLPKKARQPRFHDAPEDLDF